MTSDPRPIGSFGRFKCWLTGVDPTLLARCAARDHDSVSMIFWLQVAVWVWSSIIFTAVLHLMLANPGEPRPELIGVALLLASIITLIDSYMLIRTSWHLHGMAELTRAGLKLPGRWVTQIKFGIFGLIRTTQAAGSSVLVALFIGLLLYGKDIGIKLDHAYQQANQALFERAAAQEDADLEQLRQQKAQASDLVAKSVEDASLVRRSGALPIQEDPEFKPTAARLLRLDSARAAADAALGRAQAAYGREIRAAARRSGADAAAARQAAESRLAAAKQRSANAKREHDDARAQLANLRQQQEAAVARADARQGVRLTEAETSQQKLRDRLSEITSELDRRTASREAAIRRSVESDPAHIRRDEGLLARARALRELAEDPWIATVVILLDLFFFSVELAAVLGKTMSFVPSEYATELAKEDCQRAYDAAHELATHINQRATAAAAPAAPPGAAAPEPEPELNPDPELEPPEPDVRASDANPEHPGAPNDDDLEGLSATMQLAARLARQRAAKAAQQANGGRTGAPDGRSTDARTGPETPRRRRGRPPGTRNRPQAQDGDASAMEA